MFPTFIGILDIQSWWEVPSIAHFCSLFRAAFNLLDFDIEDLEEALLTDGGTEGRLVQELIVRLLEGCLPNDTRNDISTFNYQMFLRRLFRKKCQEYRCENPFNTDVDFELLPLRQKVEILRALCDFRLDDEDVEQSLSNLDSDSLRVEPLGHDRKNSAYWYFYGTRLYREDYIDSSNSTTHKQKGKPRDKKRKRRRNRVAKEEEKEEEKEEDSFTNSENKDRESIWQVVCFTQQDWSRLVEKFRDSEYAAERKLYRTLSEDFMPEIPKLFDLKEKQQRRKLLQRNNSRVLRSQEISTPMETVMVKSKVKAKNSKGNKKGNQSVKSSYAKEDLPPRMPTPPLPKKGRQTNNSLASAVGQIVIHTQDEVQTHEKKKGVGSQGDKHYASSNYGYKYGYSFGIEEEERRVGMHKVLESLKDHVDAWPFIDPVDEEYAPRYYSVVRKPMDLSTMEEKLEGGSYKNVTQFKRDFRLIVDNCKQYNGSDNEYTEMAFNLKEAFDKAVNRYLESEASSDEEPQAPKSLLDTSGFTPCPSQSVTPIQNTRKRSKKSSKKLKSYKSDNKDKIKHSHKVEEEEKVSKTLKTSSKKKTKRKSKVVKSEDSVDEDGEEGVESEDAISETNVTTGKGGKNAVVNSVLLKSKKLSPKELEKVNKKMGKERHQRKKDIENVKPIKDSKENRKRKEDFEEDHEPLMAKSKSRKIEKKEFEQIEMRTGSAKKTSLSKMDFHEEEEVSEKEERLHHIKLKKSRKKEKADVKTVKSEEKADKNHTKHKEKKSKVKDELKNGDSLKEVEFTEVDTHAELHSSNTDASKRMVAFTGDKDLESLDNLKDKISEKRREDKLKHEKEKQKKLVTSDLHTVYSKKVPSNGSTFHDGDKVTAKKQKLKKGVKEDKISVSEDTVKNSGQVLSGNKKTKTPQMKHSKTFRKEESSAIQALNQATEQTLHDINKWLDDAPKLSEFSSGSDSPVLHPPTEVARTGPKAEAPRKRPSSIKIFGPHGPPRPKKIQRTIDRLQPGKSKGNLLLKKPLNLPSSTSESTAHQCNSDNDQGNKDTDDEPKLSLGTVLKNVDSIQLICKSIVSSPNANASNEDDEDDRVTTSTRQSPHPQEAVSSTKTAVESCANADESKDGTVSEEVQKPKTATPNLSAWFKAFGAPKSKKKDEESEENVLKKDGELPEVCGIRQRRVSTGGSSVSESVSSFSQESPPGRSGRSPQGQPIVLPSEPAMRGAGFYQDALSTGNSPYNSPYYATPPRYSAQLPPTPSPQNHPLSPAYLSPASYDPPPIYPQAQQPTHQAFQKRSPQDASNEVYHQISPTFSQSSPQNNFSQSAVPVESYNQPLSTSNQNQSPVYMQPSSQPVQQVYRQTSPQAPPSNYSQPSPQQQPPPTYPQLSPQQNPATKYSQPSPQAAASYSQPSPQQQHSPYSQASPQQHSPYAQSSPQQSSPYSQLSPQPPPTFPQRSPQPPPVYTQQSPQPSNFSQPSPQAPAAGYAPTSPQPLTYSQTSPQPRNYSQPSPQQIQTFAQHSPQAPPTYSQQSPQSATYSQPSPQQHTNYSQPSPQQAATYSHPMQSPQTPSNYAQLSPRQMAATNFSQQSVSPQQSHYSQPSPQHKPCPTQPSPQPPSYPQQSPQQITSYTQPASSKSTEESTQNSPTPTNYTHGFKQNPSYIQASAPASTNEAEHRTEYIKASSSEKSSSSEQQRSFAVSSDAPLTLNASHPIYQTPSQFPPPYGNNFANIDLQRTASKHTSQEQHQSQQQSPQDRPNFSDISESANAQKYVQQRSFLGKTPGAAEQLQTQEQSQVLSFQQNLTAHESLYQAGFQPSGYTVGNSRQMYPNPHYFDANTKIATSVGSNTSNSNLPPVKKRVYNESSIEPARNLPQDSSGRIVQEQFAFDPMMALPQPDAVSASQFDNSFVSSLADPVATNPAYARLGLGLVSRSSKEQQLLTIPRPPPSKPEHLAYSRNPSTSTAELDLNLLQSLQNVASKNQQSTLPMPRRVNEATTSVASTSTKTKKSRKSKQQSQAQQNTVSAPPIVSTDQQPSGGLPTFPQYTSTSAESLGLKNAPVVPPPTGSAFNFAAPASTTPSSPFYDKDPTAAAAAFAFLDEFRNRNSYYSMALRQQQQQQQPQITPVTDASQPSCNKLNNPPARNYAPHSFLHSAQRSAAYGPPVSAYVSPHAPNLAVDPAAYQQYFHSFYALPHHRPSWL